MTENKLPHFLLHERLGGMLSTARKREAFCASVLGMHLHDHHVCAHGSIVLTNPERSESTSFMIFPGYPMGCHALQVMTRTII